MREILIASEGMILTDSVIYGKKIYLANGRNKEDFYEISLSAYEALTAEEESHE